MAHEIAHVAARHALENMSKSQLLSIGAVPLIFVGGPLGDLGRMGAELGLTAVFFKFSRGAEREADELGAQYLWAAGYDPESLVTFFQKLSAGEQKVKVSALYRSHPTTPDRIKDVQKLIARFPERETYVVNTREFDSLKGRGSAGRQGVLSGIGRGNTGDQRPPILRRRPSDEPSTVEASGSTSTSSEPPPSSQREDGRQPPKIVRQTDPDSQPADNSGSTPTSSSQREDGRIPTHRPGRKILRRVMKVRDRS
jgi:beta-barrel assembly-enhancing protease